MKFYTIIPSLLIIAILIASGCRKEKENYSNAPKYQFVDTGGLIRKMEGSRLLAFTRHVESPYINGDTTYRLPDETIIVKMVTNDSITIGELKNMPGKGGGLTFRERINTTVTYKFEAPFISWTLHYDFMVDTMYVEGISTYKEPNSRGGNITTYYTIGTQK